VTTYWVATTGSDANDGLSEGAPFLTIQHAVDTATTPGDIIVVHGGDYYESVLMDNAGASGSPITLQAYDRVNEPVTVIGSNDGGSTYTLPTGSAADVNPLDGTEFVYGALLRVRGDWIDVDGVNTKWSRGRGITVAGDNDGARVTNVNVSNCIVRSCRNAGCQTQYADDAHWTGITVIDGGNYAPYDRYDGSHPYTNWPGIFSMVDCSNIVADQIKVFESWGEGIIAGRDSDHVTISNSEFADNFALNAYIHRSTDGVFYNNICYHTVDSTFLRGHNYPANLAINNEGNFPTSFTVSDWLIYNNILMGGYRNIDQGGGVGGTYPFANIDILFNQIIEARSASSGVVPYGIRILDTASISGYYKVRYNVFVQSSPGVAADVPSGITFERNIWPAVGPGDSQALGTGDINADAALVSTAIPTAIDTAAADDYRLTSVSPAIGAALLPALSVASDYFAQTRGQVGGATDAGFAMFAPGGGGGGGGATGNILLAVENNVLDTTSGDVDTTSTVFDTDTPVGAIVVGVNATGIDTAVDQAKLSIGFIDDSGNQAVLSVKAKHGVTTTDDRVRGATNGALKLLADSFGTVAFAASGSLIAGGVRLSKSGTQSISARMFAALFGGADAQAKVVTFTGNGTTNASVTVTGVGFQPTLIFLLTGGAAFNDSPQASIRVGLGIVIATPTVSQAAVTFYSANDAGASDVQTEIETGVIARNFGSPDQTHQLTAVGPDSFTVQTLGNGGARYFAALCLRFENVELHLEELLTPTSTGGTSYDNADLSAGLLFLVQTLLEADATKATDATAGSLGISAVANNQYGATVSIDDAASPTNTQSIFSAGQNAPLDDGSPGVVGTTTLTATGHDTNYTAVTANAKRWLALTIQQPSAASVAADFSADVTSGTAPLAVTFTDASTEDGTTITGWTWYFGDGGTSTEQNPAHTYAEAGTYTVILIVTDGTISDTETKTDYISVSATPVSPTPVSRIVGSAIIADAPRSPVGGAAIL
jgi:PKD domain